MCYCQSGYDVPGVKPVNKRKLMMMMVRLLVKKSEINKPLNNFNR